MDPELLKLYLQAAGTPSGASRTNDLIGQLLFGYISGGMNPDTLVGQGSAGSSQLMQNYMNDPNPAIQQVIQHIQGGTDPYRLSSFVDSLVGKMPTEVADLGFQPADLKNLALAMNKEFTGEDSGGSGRSGGSRGGTGFNFSKAGLSNPLDLYNIANVPLSAEASDLISRQRAEGERGSREFDVSSQKARSARRVMEEKPGLASRTYDGSNLYDLMNRINGVRTWNPGTMRLRSRISQAVSENNGVADDAKLKKAFNQTMKEVDKSYRPQVQALFEKTIKAAKTTAVTKTNLDVNSPEFWDWRKNIENARKAAYNEQEAARGEMAVRQGALDAANKAGRTPLNDELKGRLSTLAKLRNK
jgi:hypothetical protein